MQGFGLGFETLANQIKRKPKERKNEECRKRRCHFNSTSVNMKLTGYVICRKPRRGSSNLHRRTPEKLRISAPFPSQKEVVDPARIPSGKKKSAMEPPLRPSVQGQKNESPSSNLHRNSALNAAAAFVQSTLRTLQTDSALPALRCTNSSPSAHYTDFPAPRVRCEPEERPEKPAKISAESQIPLTGLRKRALEPPTGSGVHSRTGNTGKLPEKARLAGGSEIRSAAPRESRFLGLQTPMPSDSPGEGPLESVNKAAVLLSPSPYIASGESERKPSVDAKFSRKKDDTLGTRVQLRSTAILKFLVDESYASERRIRETFGNTPDISKTLRMLVKQHRVRRFGVGGRRSPFVYMAITSPGLSELEKLNRANANGIM